MELFINSNGISEAYVKDAHYRLCEYRGERFEDEHGVWRRSMFLGSTKWVLYFLEKPTTGLCLLVRANSNAHIPHPTHLCIVPILPNHVETAIDYGAALGLEYREDRVELVAVFEEENMSADWLADEVHSTIEFYDKHGFLCFVEEEEDLYSLPTDKEKLAVWTGSKWAVYVR